MSRTSEKVVSDVGDTSNHHRGENQPIVSNAVGNMENHHGESEQSVSLSNEELAKYRSENIPIDCRLPDYENNPKKWAEHLSHHQNTQYCLEYFD